MKEELKSNMERGEDVKRYGDEGDDIQILQFGFQPVALVGGLVQIQERDRTKGERKRKTIQKHRIHEIENKNTKQTTNIKIILENPSRVILVINQLDAQNLVL